MSTRSSTRARTLILKIDWQKMMEGDGTKIKAALDKVWAIIKMMPAGREGTDAGWIAYVLDRTLSVLAMHGVLLPPEDARVCQGPAEGGKEHEIVCGAAGEGAQQNVAMTRHHLQLGQLH